MTIILGWVLWSSWEGGTCGTPAPVVQGPGMAASPTRTPASREKWPSLRATCQPRSSPPTTQRKPAQLTRGSQVNQRFRWPAGHRRTTSDAVGEGPEASQGHNDHRLVIGERRLLHWLPSCDAQHGRLQDLLPQSPPPVDTAGIGNFRQVITVQLRWQLRRCFRFSLAAHFGPLWGSLFKG